MRLNIFRIPNDKVADIKEKFQSPSLGLDIIGREKTDRSRSSFYFSTHPAQKPISWTETFSDYFENGAPENLIYFGCYLWENESHCFALSYGKCHFYLRQFCDHDFGTHMAKRIANENDIRQKSSKKFAGKKKKEIKSYTKNSRLDTESGESVDYIQASIIDDHREAFGKSGKFGVSMLLCLDIDKDGLEEFFESLISTIDLTEKFSLPRTTIINNTAKSRMFEKILSEEICNVGENTDFTNNSHELVGVDFVFSGQEVYRFKYHGVESKIFDELTIDNLREFIISEKIPTEDILNVLVLVEKDESICYRRYVKESLDYIVEDHNVILSQGNWMEFNEDYLVQLDEYIDRIEIEPTEDELCEVKKMEEDRFNEGAIAYGYQNADKDFSKIKVEPGTPVEAWDLQKGDVVYAVKVGTPQKIGYVCDQSINTLELINKKSNLRKLRITLKSYCLWLILERKTRIEKLSDIGSIIFKQKVESWARKCSDFGVVPKVKISYVK
ncbi:TIGR04141 family sporadically distributed protein [Hahella sp. CR1]|uniref:DUF6119 family protein n=1 Tax=Hahella sp. CR1 TaxID=2992807 RepID=UPI002441D25F|nr:DUF6119 family protein [Hahella sp. CR1]MDG9667060.1 TIGR04141 family sporadically distributed protein [Hahella sp. CR1]